MKKRYFAFLWAVSVSLYCVISIPEILDAWDKKISSQYTSNMLARNSNDLFLALNNSVMKEWPVIFNDESSVDSLVALNRLLNIKASGLKVPTTLLQQPRVTEVVYQDTNIGLSKVCVNNSSEGFIVGAKNISKLLSGVKHLEERLDTSIGDYTYINAKTSQQVVLHDFCVFLRTSQGGYNG